MSAIRTMEARMPPGFRFHPRDSELVLNYLLQKLSGHTHGGSGVAMVDVDLNKCEPWELPEESCVGGGNEWYFFSRRDRKYTTGDRTNRATRSGYWKATGKDRAVVAGETKATVTVVGMRKTLVFYRGRAPKGRKTEWVMHEFRLQPHLSKDDWVLCRVFIKSRITTTLRPPSEDQACMTSCEPDQPAAPPVAPAVATDDAFDSSRIAGEQVSCFSGLPSVTFRTPVSVGDLLPIDTSEKEAMGIMTESMTSMIGSGLDLAVSWEQENDMTQMWNPLYY